MGRAHRGAGGLLALVLAAASPVAADPIAVPALDTGHWANFGVEGIGFHDPSSPAGLALILGWWTEESTAHHDVRGYMVFDLAAVPPDALLSAATIRFQNGPASYDSPDPEETVAVRSLHTDPEVVMREVVGPPDLTEIGPLVYDDLADGALLGSYRATPADSGAISAISLNAAGIAEFQAAIGDRLAVGLHLTSTLQVVGENELFARDTPEPGSLVEVVLELEPVCDDGLDNDGDGAVDASEDVGCSGPDDVSEKDPALPCDDGVDNDGDGWIDVPDDPGCGAILGASESPACSDGLDNDADGGIDFDGGLQATGAVVGPPDPDCDAAHGWREKRTCGLGAELALVLLLVGSRRSRRAAQRAVCASTRRASARSGVSSRAPNRE